MQKKNGFTLVEIIAVIIIIGIVLIIAIPAVSKYINNSNKASFAADAQGFIENVRSEYEMEYYGKFIKSDELMIVPIEYIDFEKGLSKEGPFGDYDLSKSYILIAPERNGYQFYATIIDVNGIGVVMKSNNELSKNSVENELTDRVTSWAAYKSGSLRFDYNDKTYSKCEIRDIESLEKNYEDAIIVLCED